jgi:hypothetical protein
MKTACTIALIMGISLNMYAQNKEEQSTKQFASFNLKARQTFYKFQSSDKTAFSEDVNLQKVDNSAGKFFKKFTDLGEGFWVAEQPFNTPIDVFNTTPTSKKDALFDKTDTYKMRALTAQLIKLNPIIGDE